jgi:N-acetylneuraminic acid mutarotase
MKRSFALGFALIALMALCLFSAELVHAAEALVENTWKTLSPMPTARAFLGVVATNGKIYAIGGNNGSGDLPLIEMYDPGTDSWTIKTPIMAGSGANAAAVLNGKIYAIGETASTGYPHDYYPANNVYDPATNNWETKTAMPQIVIGASAAVVGNKIYVIGGNLNFAYDPSTDSWTTRSPPPAAVTFYACAVVNDKIYAIGGTSSTLTQIYNPETDTWTNGTAPPIGGYVTGNAKGYVTGAATTGVYAPKRIYVMGGGNWIFPSNLNLIYDPETDS